MHPGFRLLGMRAERMGFLVQNFAEDCSSYGGDFEEGGSLGWERSAWFLPLVRERVAWRKSRRAGDEVEGG